MKKKLLIVAQKIDINDPVLGFFHGWVNAFSKHFESVIVICLEKGIYSLPSNVKVLSLGKEEKNSRWLYVTRFFRFIWQERSNYDVVFVHMNQEYVLLGAKIWHLLGKKIYMWRNHKVGSFLTTMSVFLSNTVFYTSPKSFTAKFKKSIQMPVGIDTSHFCPSIEIIHSKNSILSIGRLSPIKNIEFFIQALIELDKSNISFTATIIGSPVNDDDIKYADSLYVLGDDLVKKGKLKFIKAVAQKEIIRYYNLNEIFVNLTPSGSLDKTIFEAMACGSMAVTANEMVGKEIDSRLLFEDKNVGDLVRKILLLFSLSIEEKEKIVKVSRNYVLTNHSLESLVTKFVNQL